MNNSTLTNALPIVAAAYGRKFGVQIQIGGTGASTNGTVIQIPAVADTVKNLAYGYLAHEAGHVRFTEFALARHSQPLGRFVEGILEDVRIENAMIRIYPGTRSTLDSVFESLINDGTLNPVSDQLGAPVILCNGVLHLARHRYRNQAALSNYAKHADQTMRQVFGARFVHRLHGLLTEVPTLQNTADSMMLARKIVALVEEESKNPTPEPSPGEEDEKQSEDNDQEDEQPAQGSGGEESETENPEGEGADDGSKDQGDEQDDLNDPSPTSGAEGQSQGAENLGQDARNALQSILNATEKELPEDIFKTVGGTLGEKSNSSPTLLPTTQCH